jgi:hypothetical protein
MVQNCVWRPFHRHSQCSSPLFEGDLGGAIGTADVEPEDLNTEVLFVRDLLARVESSTLVDVLTTGGALHRKRSPKAHGCKDRVTSLASSFLLPVDPILWDGTYSKPSSPT